MSDAESVPPTAAIEPPRPVPPPRNPLRRPLLIVLAIALLLFAYSLFADRLTPYTAQATVQAYVVRISPEVSGTVVAVAVVDNARVEAGQELFRIDAVPYELAVESAEAELALAGQAIGGSTAGVAAAQAKLAAAQAELDNVQQQAARVLELVERGVYPKARADQATSQLQSAEANVERAEAELEQAQQELGPAGNDNPQIRAALAALEQAQWKLARTIVRAPTDGVVTNLQTTLGQYAGVGQPVLTFIDATAVWVSANLPENSLEHLEAGDPAEITLDVLPGRVFKAQVESVGWGVSGGGIDPATGLPTIREQTGWVRDAQRFPVRLIFEGGDFPKGVRFGSQANIIVYATDSTVMDLLGRVWIRFVAALSYLT